MHIYISKHTYTYIYTYAYTYIHICIYVVVENVHHGPSLFVQEETVEL